MSGRTNWFGAGVIFVVAALTAGCGPDRAGTSPPSATDRGHEHPVGPHKGTLVEWGKEYHAEVVADREKGQATVYVLARNAKSPAPIAADTVLLSVDDPAIQVELKPAPQPSDPKGTSSRFLGTLPDSARAWRLTGTVEGTVDGKRYSGEFQEARPHKH